MEEVKGLIGNPSSINSQTLHFDALNRTVENSGAGMLSPLIVIAAAFVFLVGASPARPSEQSASPQRDGLKTFLLDYVASTGVHGSGTTRYFATMVDLKDDGEKYAIVYLTGDGWCGSSGCRVLVLAPEGGSYRVVTAILVAKPPISVLPTKSNGWHDISVFVQGGGVMKGYKTRLCFDGKTYPKYASAPPAQRLGKGADGRVVVPLGEVGTPLYP